MAGRLLHPGQSEKVIYGMANTRKEGVMQFQIVLWFTV